MKICIAGKNTIAVYGLHEAISAVGNNNVLVCCNRTDHGVSNWQPSLRRFAKEWGVEEVLLEDLYLVEDLIFISLEFDRLINPSLFKSKQLYNVHFSKLPAYKGMYTSAWPILNGEVESGVTLHCLDYGIDTGEIIDQITFPLETIDTARHLYLKYLKYAETLLSRNFENILAGETTSCPQTSFGSTYYGKKSINYQSLMVDTKQTAEVVTRQIRAFSFREFQVATIDGFPVGDFEILKNRSIQSAGSIEKLNDNKIYLSTIDYDVVLFRDQSLLVFDLIEKNDVEGVHKWILNGGNPNITNKNGWSPLIVACYKGKKNVVEILINMGANPTQSNQNGTTPLMYAKEYGQSKGDFSIFDILLSSGADIHKKDRFGKSVLDYAKENKQLEFIDYIKGCRSNEH